MQLLDESMNETSISHPPETIRLPVRHSHIRNLETNSSQGATIDPAFDSCADSNAPFRDLVRAQGLVWGDECTQYLPLSSVLFSPFYDGGLAAVCKATVGFWTSLWTTDATILNSNIGWTPPISTTAIMAELCPGTCSAAGVFTASCSSLSPTSPPASPSPPNPPSAPPLALSTEGQYIIHTAIELRAALAMLGAQTSISIYIPENCSLRLDGSPLLVAGGNATIRSEGAGATIDAQRLSHVVEVRPTSWLRLTALTLANGHASVTGGGLSIVRAHLEMASCSVLNCSAAIGGAISVVSGSVLLRQCDLRASTASVGGGLFIGRGSVLQLLTTRLIGSYAYWVSVALL